MSRYELSQPLLEEGVKGRQSESSEKPLEATACDFEPELLPKKLSRSLSWLLKALLASALTLAVFSVGIYVGRISIIYTTKTALLGDYSSFSTSPPLAPVQIRFRGTLAAYSPFKGPPSPEVDESWHSITKEVYISVPEDQLTRAGFDPTVSVRDPLNETNFLAELEYRHYLHCLEYIFKYTYFDYYEGWLSEREANSTTLRIHVDHCFDLLRQYVECKADPGFAPFVWVQNQQSPYPNFNTPHVCQDINVVRDWELGFKRGFEVFTQASRSRGQKEMTSPP